MPVDEFGREILGVARGAPSPSPSPPRSRRHGSPPPSDEEISHRPRHHHHRRHRKRSPSPPPVHRPRRQHASEKYVKEPLLCEYVWKHQSNKKESNKEEEGADEGEPLKDDEEDAPKDDDKKQETYDEYRQEYCLNYVRAFFNEHMDDSWFRKTYSPLEKKRAVMEELERASQEATALTEQVKESSSNFVEQARLGNGTKETGVATRKRKYSEDNVSSTVNAVPQSHVLSTHDRTLVLHDIPPHVTDEQLSQALLDQCSSPSPIKIFSSSVSSTTKPPLVRSAHALLTTPAVRKDLLQNLKNSQAHHHHVKEGHVPRKEDEYMPKELDLDVDCSDPFGRLEVDEDGKGGGDGSRTVPHLKCIVVVSTSPPRQQVTVLSAAVSSLERIPRDKDAAVMLARALDVSRSIPSEHRLDRVLEILPSDTPGEDLLDVSIAYLRRVHLFSFYNGCNYTKNLGDVLSGQHATGTIHLRLKGADELLEEGEENTGPDMLVTRLDDSISRALEESTAWVDNTYVLDETRDKDAAEIEEMEEQARYDWIENHGVVDGDGRARCSFHFCRKLFKDDSFLKKHLLKKHGEFLKAEQAKCHDSFMMKAWDEESNRPVPPVLVDCGANFGRVPVPVVGAQPMAEDPEPELWRKEEEKRRRAEEEKERYQERRDDYGPPRAPRDHADEPPRANRPSNFVDVDDMKEEKVELSFENVKVVAPPPKKKKKKKKLL